MNGFELQLNFMQWQSSSSSLHCNVLSGWERTKGSRGQVHPHTDSLKGSPLSPQRRENTLSSHIHTPWEETPGQKCTWDAGMQGSSQRQQSAYSPPCLLSFPPHSSLDQVWILCCVPFPIRKMGTKSAPPNEPPLRRHGRTQGLLTQLAWQQWCGPLSMLSASLLGSLAWKPSVTTMCLALIGDQRLLPSHLLAPDVPVTQSGHPVTQQYLQGAPWMGRRGLSLQKYFPSLELKS